MEFLTVSVPAFVFDHELVQAFPEQEILPHSRTVEMPAALERKGGATPVSPAARDRGSHGSRVAIERKARLYGQRRVLRLRGAMAAIRAIVAEFVFLIDERTDLNRLCGRDRRFPIRMSSS